MPVSARKNRLRHAAVVASLVAALGTGVVGPAAASAASYNEPCTEAGLHPEYQGQGFCADSPPPAPAPERANPLPLGIDVILGGLLGR